MSEQVCVQTKNVHGFPLHDPCSGRGWQHKTNEACDPAAGDACTHHEPLYAPVDLATGESACERRCLCHTDDAMCEACAGLRSALGACGIGRATCRVATPDHPTRTICHNRTPCTDHAAPKEPRVIHAARLRAAWNVLSRRSDSERAQGELSEWGEPLRYLTDDRDEDQRNELVIMQGGNGDWYVSVVPEGEGTMGRGVLICTSGGAARAKPGLGNAIAAAYRALRTESEAREPECPCPCHTLRDPINDCAGCCEQPWELWDSVPRSLLAPPADLRALAEEITRATKRAIDCDVDAAQCISQNDYHEQCIAVGTNAALEVLSRHFGRRS